MESIHSGLANAEHRFVTCVETSMELLLLGIVHLSRNMSQSILPTDQDRPPNHSGINLAHLRSKRTKQGRRQDREYKYKQCLFCSSFANQQPPIPPNDAHTCQLSALGETNRCSPRVQPTRSLATGANLLRKIINPPLARCFTCAALDRA